MKAFASLLDDVDPTIPEIAADSRTLLGTLANDDLDIEAIADELMLHPSIAARLIALANSAWSSPESGVVELKEACVRLGLGVVKSSAIAYAVAAPFDPTRCVNFDGLQFWTCSLLSAEAAQKLAPSFAVDVSVARMGGLLRNLGLLWFAHAVPVDTNLALGESRAQRTALGALLLQHVGATHLQASLQLFKAWGLPSEVRSICDDDGTPSAQLGKLSATLAQQIYTGEKPQTTVTNEFVSAKQIEATLQYLERVLERIKSIAQSANS